MTKKHFIALADHIKANMPFAGYTERMISDLADFCASQNPRFDRARCDYNGLEVTMSQLWFGVACALFYGIGYVRGRKSAVRKCIQLIREVGNERKGR